MYPASFNASIAFSKALSIAGCRGSPNVSLVKPIFNGECIIKIYDGQNENSITLKQGEGLFIVPGIWRELNEFSPGSLIVVLASELYDINDYIFQKDEFLKYKR